MTLTLTTSRPQPTDQFNLPEPKIHWPEEGKLLSVDVSARCSVNLARWRRR
jgi:hypothetical protein